MGFKILGFALEHVTGLTFGAIMHNIITGPLQMSNTFIQIPPYMETFRAQGYARDGHLVSQDQYSLYINYAASGALISTSRDMMKYLNGL